MTKKIAVSIGHNPKDPGASHENYSEYSEMAVLAGILISKLERAGHRAYMVGTGSLGKKIKEVNAIGADCAIELHLNTGGGHGHGHETLYCPGSVKGEKLATLVNSLLGEALGSRNRGVKEGWYRMDHPDRVDYPGDVPGDEDKDVFLDRTNCPAIIVEPFFLDNAEERAKYIGSYGTADAVGSKIAAGVIEFLKG